MSALTPTTLDFVDVTTAGTPEQISTSSILCVAVVFQALTTNSGNIYIGDANVDNSTDTKRGITLAAGETFVLSNQLLGGTNINFDIADWYVNADNNDDAVGITYLQNARSTGV
jgi:hypothetical protein